MRRTGRLAAVLAALALAVTACGGGGDGGAGGAPAGGGGGEAAELTLPNLAGQTVEVAAVWTGTEQERFEQVLTDFEQRTGATVNYTSTGDDIATVLGTRLAGGSPPDVAILPQPGLLAQFAQQGALKEVSPETRTAIEANYADVWQQLGTVDGTLYGVWFKAANKSTVWYRADAFQQAGVEPPTDWQGFLDTATTISNSGVTPVSMGAADGWTLTDWFENVYLDVAGPETYDRLVRHEIPWTDPSVGTALTTLAQLWSQPNLIVGGQAGALQTPFPESVTQVFGANPTGAVVYEGDFVAGVISEETPALVGQDALFFDFPSVDGAAPSVVGGGDVAVKLTESPGAEALMTYLAAPQSAQIWAGLGGFVSPNQNLDTAVYPDDVSRQIAEAVRDAETFRFDLSDQTPAEFGGTPGQGMWKILQDFLANPSNVQGTQQALEQAAAAAYGG